MYQLLIADDEYEIRTGLANYFPWTEMGFEVAGTCEDGLQVLTFLESHIVHVLLCDIRMPMMNGLELARTLCEKKSSVKIIFLSGYKDFEYVRQALIYGARDYIAKPTKYAELTEVFHKLKLELDAQYLIKEEETIPDKDLYTIRKIKQMIEKNYATVTLESISHAVYLNPSYISKLFKQKTNKNFFDYVTEVRMLKAVSLLQDMEQKTYEISELVGYSNPKNFTRAFKKYYHMTPSDYRNQLIAKE